MPAIADTQAELLVHTWYIYFYHRTLSTLPHDCLPTLEPGTRCRISAGFMAPGHETPRDSWRRDTKLRVLVRGVLRGRGAAVRVFLATCALSPCASKVLRKPEASTLRGLGPPRTERVRGVASVGRSGPGEVLSIIFGSGGPGSVYVSQSAPSEKMGSFATEPQQAVVSWFSLFFTRSCMHDICEVCVCCGVG